MLKICDKHNLKTSTGPPFGYITYDIKPKYKSNKYKSYSYILLLYLYYYLSILFK